VGVCMFAKGGGQWDRDFASSVVPVSLKCGTWSSGDCLRLMRIVANETIICIKLACFASCLVPCLTLFWQLSCHGSLFRLSESNSSSKSLAQMFSPLQVCWDLSAVMSDIWPRWKMQNCLPLLPPSATIVAAPINYLLFFSCPCAHHHFEREVQILSLANFFHVTPEQRFWRICFCPFFFFFNSYSFSFWKFVIPLTLLGPCGEDMQKENVTKSSTSTCAMQLHNCCNPFASLSFAVTAFLHGFDILILKPNPAHLAMQRQSSFFQFLLQHHQLDDQTLLIVNACPDKSPKSFLGWSQFWLLQVHGAAVYGAHVSLQGNAQSCFSTFLLVRTFILIQIIPNPAKLPWDTTIQVQQKLRLLASS